MRDEFHWNIKTCTVMPMTQRLSSNAIELQRIYGWNWILIRTDDAINWVNTHSVTQSECHLRSVLFFLVFFFVECRRDQHFLVNSQNFRAWFSAQNAFHQHFAIYRISAIEFNFMRCLCVSNYDQNAIFMEKYNNISPFIPNKHYCFSKLITLLLLIRC